MPLYQTHEEAIAILKAGGPKAKQISAVARQDLSQGRIAVTQTRLESAARDLQNARSPEETAKARAELDRWKSEETLFRGIEIEATREMKAAAATTPVGEEQPSSERLLSQIDRENSDLRSRIAELETELSGRTAAAQSKISSLTTRVNELENGTAFAQLESELTQHRAIAEAATRNLNLLEGFTGTRGVHPSDAIAGMKENEMTNDEQPKSVIRRVIRDGQLVPVSEQLKPAGRSR